MILRPEEAQHLSGQEFNIIRTISKWWQLYLDDVKPVIQVFSKSAFPEPFFEVCISSGNNADIGLSCLLITDTFVFMVLQLCGSMYGWRGLKPFFLCHWAH